jgi:Flp pilus assembly pilin Flp
VSRMVAGFRVDSTSNWVATNARSARSSRRKGVNASMWSFTDLVRYLRAREEGQTMAEYGVVLAVITGVIVLALLALSGAIEAAINNVVGFL